MQPEHKANKRLQPEITGTVLKSNKTLYRHHICSPNLGTGKKLSTEPRHKNNQKFV